MKRRCLALLVLLAGTMAVHAQMTTISSVSSAGGLGPVTTISPGANGFNYATIGGPNGGQWGSVQVTGGNTVSAAVTPQGGVVPVISPATPLPVPSPAQDPWVVSAQIAAANSQQLAADVQILNAMADLPAVPRSIRVERAIPVTRPDPVNAEFVTLFNKIGSKERRAQFWRDFQADFPAGSVTNFPTRAALPYLKLWLRDHGNPMGGPGDTRQLSDQ